LISSPVPKSTTTASPQRRPAQSRCVRSTRHLHRRHHRCTVMRNRKPQRYQLSRQLPEVTAAENDDRNTYDSCTTKIQHLGERRHRIPTTDIFDGGCDGPTRIISREDLSQRHMQRSPQCPRVGRDTDLAVRWINQFDKCTASWSDLSKIIDQVVSHDDPWVVLRKSSRGHELSRRVKPPRPPVKSLPAPPSTASPSQNVSNLLCT